MFVSKVTLRVVFTAFFLVFLSSTVVFADFVSGSYRDRRTGDSPRDYKDKRTFGPSVYPKKLFSWPKWYEHSPLISNWDQRNTHKDRWAGQEWDDCAWGDEWTNDVTIENFFKVHVFHKRYLRGGGVPVLEIGPIFYKLSDLDQRRSLKLVTDYFEIFERGHEGVELVDWSTRKRMGVYMLSGMYLD